MILQTRHLLLRELTLADADDLQEIFGDPEAMRYYPAPFSREKTEDWIKRALASYSVCGYGLWAVVLRETGEVIGDCGLVPQHIEGIPELEIGYHIKRSHWGRGYGTEAACACRDYAFEQIGVLRVVSIVDPQNMRSRRVAEKVHTGMRMFTWHHNGREMCLYFCSRASD